MKLPSTLSVLYFLSILAAAWECWTICNRESGDTFSATIRKLGESQTFIPMMSGALMRHLFGQAPCREAFLTGWMAGEFWPLLDKEEIETAGDSSVAANLT